MSSVDVQRIRSGLSNRHVGTVFGVLAIFVVVLQVVMRLELDPFASIAVRILVIPGWVVMMGYAVLVVEVPILVAVDARLPRGEGD